MQVFNFKTINTGYISLVSRLLTDPCDFQKLIIPKEEKAKIKKGDRNKFINKKSRFHLRNVHILFENPQEFKKYNVHCPKRTETMNKYIQAETKLFDEGIIDATEMGKISCIWKHIRNPDNTINANYGHMVYHLKDAGDPNFTSQHMSQWEWCQHSLLNNPHTLQAIMHFNRPKDQYVDNLDQPCTVFTQFTVTDDKLNFHSFMRSNDIIYGTPYNLAYFKLLQGRMIQFLHENGYPNIGWGFLHHNVTSLHLYEDKIDIAENITGIKRKT
jgi:thymidylate synthase